MADTFHCTLVTPERQVFEQEAVYASIPAWDGQLGVAHQRAPLLAKLGDGALRVDDATGTSHWYFIAGGFAQMRENRLSLVANDAVPAGDVTRQSAEAQLSEALARQAITDEEVAKKHRDTERARSLLSILDHK